MTSLSSTSVGDLWADGHRLPAGDALHLPDGTSYRVRLDPSVPAGFRLGARITGSAEEVAYVDGLVEVRLDGGGVLWGGEGDHGSQGFAARLTVGGALVWALFLEESNPFTRVVVEGREAVFRSTSGVVVRLGVEDPGSDRADAAG
ncbi:hypothetical protein [Streptomyces sp. NPDC050145]|uniref:hypothetical protein n=1 Tax=Streptomyces sp. NPDC050145 TaxID=3365602 RepID=UPI00379A1C6A